MTENSLKGRKGLLRAGGAGTENLPGLNEVGEMLYSDDVYSLLALNSDATDVGTFLANPLSIAWSQRPDLIQHIAALTQENNITQLLVPPQRSVEDLDVLRNGLAKHDVSVECNAGGQKPDAGYMEGEDTDEITRRLRDLGYL